MLLLFSIVLEVLARVIRQGNHIRGKGKVKSRLPFQTGKGKVKSSLLMGDMIFICKILRNSWKTVKTSKQFQ